MAVVTRQDDRPGERLPSTSIVIPTMGRVHRLETLLLALLEDPDIAEVVVVVDGPDGEAETVLGRLAIADPRLRPIFLAVNVGRMAARAEGVDRATGEVVLLLDDDVTPSVGLSAGHARHHLGASDLVVAGPLITPLPSPIRSGDAPTLLYAVESTSWMRDPRPLLHRLWGGNLSLRRATAQRVGLLAPGFERLPHEDTDFGLRAAAAGCTGLLDPSLAVPHEHRRTLRAFATEAEAYGRASVLLANRHPHASPVRTPATPRIMLLLIGWIARSSIATHAVTELLVGLAALHPSVELALARLLRRVRHRRGAHTMQAELEGATP